MSSLIVLIIGTALGTGGIGALVTVWVRRKREPIEQDGLILVQAKEAMSMARELSKDLHNEMDKMKERFSSEIQQLRDEVAALRNELAEEHARAWRYARNLEAWWDWYDDLMNKWPFHREKPLPPPGPNVENMGEKRDGT